MNMQQTLTNLITLEALVKEVHWNARGRGFISVHDYLDTVYYDCERYIDTIAEHMVAVAIYGIPQWTIGEFETFPQLLVRDRTITTGLRDIVLRLDEFVNDMDEFLANTTDDPAGEHIIVECYQTFNRHLWQLSSELG